jgi:hypothetical protein
MKKILDMPQKVEESERTKDRDVSNNLEVKLLQQEVDITPTFLLLA